MTEVIQERAFDKRVVNLILMVFILLIAEGAMRKWILPSLSSPIFFLKDAIILFIYALVFSRNRTPKHPLCTIAFLLWFVFFIQIAVQLLFFEYQIYALIYGWRNYCLYIPFSFIIADFLKLKDIIKIAKFTCIIAIPIAVLVFVQYKSPKDAFINKNVGNDTTEIFTVDGGAVRPSGPFSFNTGMSNFTGLFFVMLLFNFFMGKRRFLKPIVFYLSIFSFFVCLTTSGSRGSYLTIMIEFGSLFISSIFLLNRKQGGQIFASIALMIVITFILFTFVFDEQIAAILKRQETASAQEGSLIMRGLANFIDLEALFNSDLTFVGSGLGMGSGGGAYLATGTKAFLLSETEWSRHILEAGIVMGFIYIFYRIAICINILKGAINSLIATRNPIPLVFFSATFFNIISGPITGNGIAYGFAWITLGFSMAINKAFSEQSIDKLNVDIS